MNDYSLDQLIDSRQLQNLLEAQVHMTNLSCGLMDNDGNIFAGVMLNDVCARFHWNNPHTFARCWRNGPDIERLLQTSFGKPNACCCDNGMTHFALPIVIEGRCLGAFFSGQFFYDDAPPDLDGFRRKAETAGIDTEGYLAAVRRLPLFSRAYVDKTMRFLHLLVQQLAETGHANLLQLRELEERKRLDGEPLLLSKAVNTSEEAFFLIDEQLRFVYVNDTACRSLGYSREELLTMTQPDIDPDLTREMGMAMIRTILETGVIGPFETRHRAKNGGIFTVEINATLFEYAGAKYFLALARNIAERKRLEEELAQRERQFRTLAENIPDLIIRYDTQLRRTYVNPAWEKASGLSAAEVINVPFPETPGILKASDAEYAGKLRKVLATGGSERIEFEWTDVHGEPLSLEYVIVPEYDRQEDISGLLAVGRDITAHKQIEQLAQARLRMLEAAYAPDITLNEALQSVLDEIEARTGSSIGFYHYIDEAQKHLSLQSWSSNTGSVTCAIRENECHYPVSMAGVWAEVMLERRPVIHNDYASLSRHRGMPKGHPPVVRDLVVPVFRNGKIVAVIGLANKPTDYTETDARIASLLGDFSWEIVTRKQAEEALRERTEQWRTLAENSPDVIVRYDRNCRRMYVNPAFERINGLSLQEVRGKSPLELSTGLAPVAPLFTQKLKEVMESGVPTEIDLAWRRPRGDFACYFIRLAPEYNALGEVVSVLAVFSDISERKRMEEQLRASEQEFRTLAESLPDNIVRFDRKGRTVYVNAVLEKTLVDAAANMISTHIRGYYPDGSCDVFAQAVDDTLASGKNNEIELVASGSGEEPIVHQIRTIAERDERGEVVGVLAIGRDITEQKRAEETRQATLRFFEAMDRVNRAIQGAEDLEGMMSDVLDVVLSLFDCDRAFLMQPCDPEAESWTSPMERTRPQYPGGHALGIKLPMGEEVSETLRILLASDGPVKFGPDTPHPLPADVSERFGFQSFMSMALHPKLDKPWQFGIHQCSHVRQWTADEERLFEAIGRRLADGLSSLLIFRDLQESEARYRMVFENSPVSLWEEDFSGVKSLFDQLKADGVDNLEDCFDRQPELITYCGEQVKVIDINRAGLALHGAKDKEELLLGLVGTFTPESFVTFRQELVGLWQGKTQMCHDSVVKTLAGEPRQVTVYVSVCPGYEATLARCLVSLIDITDRKRAEQKLFEKQQRLHGLALELALSEQRERRRIASDLHDSLGQELTLAKIKIGSLDKTGLAAKQKKLLAEISRLTESSIDRVRSLTRQICPPILESAGLEAALKWLARQLEADYGLQIAFYDDKRSKPVLREFQMELYTCVRELLINVAKHAGTTTACLSLSREADMMAIQVEDDGVGFEAEHILNNAAIDGFGLFTIKHRIAHMDGSFRIHSTLGSGTEVTIKVPLEKDGLEGEQA